MMLGMARGWIGGLIGGSGGLQGDPWCWRGWWRALSGVAWHDCYTAAGIGAI